MTHEQTCIRLCHRTQTASVRPSPHRQDGTLTPLIKQLTEAALEAGIEHYSEQAQPQAIRRNAYGQKTLKAASGSFELPTPRERNGGFEPHIVKKNPTHLSDEIDDKIISLFALGMG